MRGTAGACVALEIWNVIGLVLGNRVAQSGLQQLRGVNVAGPEHMCVHGWGVFEGPVDAAAVAALRTWAVNTVRLHLNEACWLGDPALDARVSGEAYRRAVVDYVRRLRTNGITVVVALSFSYGKYMGPGKDCPDKLATCRKPMPDKENAPKFWRSVATTLKNDDGVIFDLFNEPYPDQLITNKDAAWKCLRDGGRACPGFEYGVAGMQDLVDAVRSTTARNTLLVPGLAWTHDISRLLEFMPRDPANNMAVSWHGYDYNGCNYRQCWESTIAPVAVKYRVIATSIGTNKCNNSYTAGLMDWLDEKGIGYTVYTWNTWDCSTLIKDYKGTPTDTGKYVKSHLVQRARQVGAGVSPRPPPITQAAAGQNTSSGSLPSPAGGTAFGGRQLRGVNRSGQEIWCVNGWGIFEGPTDDASITAMKSWLIDVVRLPLNEDCWLSLNGVNPAFSGQKYRAAIIDYVQRLRQNHFYVILDLHWTDGLSTQSGQDFCASNIAKCQKPMPDKNNAPKFWRSVASQREFKNDDGIIFDLFNEPVPDSVMRDRTACWKCWRDGGRACVGFQYEIAGMQQLLDEVRGAGATNLVMLGGISWAHDLSQWETYMPKDSANNLAISWHSYESMSCTNQACWESQIAPLAARHTMIVSELGDVGCKHDYTDRLLDWLDQKHISYVDWTWNLWPCGPNKIGQGLITAYDGTPSVVGIGYKNHLAKRFAQDPFR